jgi:cbb3-type cytochrome oxidase subunit 3
MMLREYAVAAAVVALVSALAASHMWAYSAGKKNERIASVIAAQEALSRQEKLADELEQARKNREVVVRERVRFVDRVVDPVGCLDVPLPDGVYEKLPRHRPAGKPTDSPSR